MTAEDTNNQAGGADTTEGATIETQAATDTLQGGASGESSGAENATGSAPADTAGEPQPDAPETPAEKLHAASIAFIIAARTVFGDGEHLGAAAGEYVVAKIEEIRD